VASTAEADYLLARDLLEQTDRPTARLTVASGQHLGGSERSLTALLVVQEAGPELGQMSS
jgi:hypothetical protein